jgi:hypothetical protein
MTFERGNVRKIIGLTTALVAGQVAMGAHSPHEHSPPERVYAQASGKPVLIHLPPDCMQLAITPVCESPISTEPPTTESTTTTTVTLQPSTTTETQPLQQAPPSETTPPDPNQPWQAPDGCMVPMGPLEAKSEAEAHRCWDGLLALYPWPQGEAFNVMYCESKGNPYADNPSSTAEGLMQVLDGSDDPRTNMDQAISKYQASDGWGQWSCKP